jgi:heme A synthase
MRKVFVGLSTVLVLAIVVQFYLAAVGAFDTAPNDESFGMHRILGYMILLLAILATIVAAVARMPGTVIGRSALIAGLTLLQGLIRALADALGDTGDTTTTAGRLVFGLHALNGLAIMGVAGTTLRQARSREAVASGAPRAESDATQTAAEPPTSAA